jgi:O-antigen ligase
MMHGARANVARGTRIVQSVEVDRFAARLPERTPLRAEPASLVHRLALATICAVAAAVPTDWVVAYAAQSNGSFRTPSVLFALVAVVLSAPFFPGASGLGRRAAPIVLIAGSMVAGIVSLLVLRWSGVRGGPLPRLDGPFRLAIMSLLFAFAARHETWRRRLVDSYLLGWSVFVTYGLYLLFSGLAEVVQHYEGVMRASLVGLDQNDQSVLLATGMVLLLDEAFATRSFVKLPLCLGALLAGGVAFASGVSRSATLALACGVVVVVFGWVRSGAARVSRGPAKLALVVVFLAGGAAWVFQSNPMIGESVGALSQRFGAALDRRDLGQRDDLVQRTWRMATANPWHGVGFGGSREYLGKDPHNGYLRILAEGGAPAGLLLFAGLVLVGSSLARQVGRGQRAGPAGALVVLLVWAAVGQALVEVPFWFFLGVVAGTREERGS